jgi:hypothetical protein
MDGHDADESLNSSGMCKAGFAGDEAPRAVFRKLSTTIPTYHLDVCIG